MQAHKEMYTATTNDKSGLLPVILVLGEGVVVMVMDPLLLQGQSLYLQLSTLCLLHGLELMRCWHGTSEGGRLGQVTERSAWKRIGGRGCRGRGKRKSREKEERRPCHRRLSRVFMKMSITVEIKKRKKLNKYMDEEPSPHRTAVGVAPRCQWGGEPGWGCRVWLLGRGGVSKVTPRPTGPSGGEPRPSLDANDVMRNTGYIK